MLKLAKKMTVLLIAVLLAACSATGFQVGSDFNVKTFTDRVERGATTKQQVRSWLGEPNGTGVRVETDGGKFDEWTYYFAEGTVSNMSAAKLKTLQIKYDMRGIVQGYNWSAP
ncbi:MAG: hypothetical protein WC216_02965 [Gallionella sp.]